ncbi:hypothetical protein [uncultured Desulfosarcina sp.]|uniref:hypothetical protein n=1 Tax=uncultured Desulfosarcina sp. TaxID=218289 RepID=UPI0029C6B1BA|nr:hypothetical protein [uncultured Desulfosarcina sp.]
MESVAALNNWILAGTLIFAAITGILVFLSTGKSRSRIQQLSKDLESSGSRIKSLEKAAESIRKELLSTQQHQDISQLKLETSNKSADDLRQELLDARKRLEIAEAAVRERKEQQQQLEEDTEVFDDLELELEPEGGLSESQREQLIDLLDPGPKGNVDIYCVMGNVLSETMARQLDEVLTSDGWKTNGVAQSAFSDPPEGLALVVNSKETAPSYASFIQRVFTTIGLDVSAKVNNKYREWSLSIIVGVVD